MTREANWERTLSTQCVGKKVAVSVMFDIVKIEVICGDNYEAQVLYDDICDRMKAGEGITLALSQNRSVSEGKP